MDRKLYKVPFQENSVPDWQCPTCQKGFLLIVDKTFVSRELALSKRGKDHPEWDPDWIQYTYSCMLECSNEKCKEVVANIGSGRVDWDVELDEEGIPEQVYSDYFKPLYFYPHLMLIKIPANTPEEVKSSLEKSFNLFFASPASAANNVRIAVEELLTSLGVKRYLTIKGKRRFITLHERISLLPVKYNELKDLFLAVKWLGNAGSHSGETLSVDDVMDSYEIIEHILGEIFEEKSSKVKAIAKKIIKAKGPKKKA
ncbi:MAG TPA: DUF4145 domain-containing protein [Cellvibrio sp.]|nr:DUF4145 domain-containing protein [Cellvibrio sp.]